MRRMAMGLTSMVGTLMALSASVQSVPDHNAVSESPVLMGCSPKGHGWGGKRRKLKKYAQDHQRPHRRRK